MLLIRLFLAFALFFAVALGDSPAALAQDDTARAVELITQANGDYDAGNFKSALDKYREVYDMTEDPRVLYRIGLTYENLANYQRAREHLELYLLAEPDSQYAGRVKSKVENLRQLEAALQAAVRVASNPPGARVWIDNDEGKPAGVTPVRIPVGPGEHELILKKEGFEVARQTVTVEAKETLETTVDLQASGSPIVTQTPEGEDALADSSDVTEPPDTADPSEIYTGEPTRVRLGPSTGLSAVSWIAIGLGWGILAFAGTATGASLYGAGVYGSGFVLGAALITLGAYFLWIRDYTSELPTRPIALPGLSAPPTRSAGIGLRF